MLSHRRKPWVLQKVQMGSIHMSRNSFLKGPNIIFMFTGSLSILLLLVSFSHVNTCAIFHFFLNGPDVNTVLACQLLKLSFWHASYLNYIWWVIRCYELMWKDSLEISRFVDPFCVWFCSYLHYGLLAARAEILSVKITGHPCILKGFDGMLRKLTYTSTHLDMHRYLY